MDLAFLLDSSGSVDDENPDAWTQMLSFVSSVVRRFQVAESRARVGLIRYSDNAEVIFYLNYSRLVNDSMTINNRITAHTAPFLQNYS